MRFSETSIHGGYSGSRPSMARAMSKSLTSLKDFCNVPLQVKNRKAKGLAILALTTVAFAYGWWRADRETKALRLDYEIVRGVVNGSDYPMTVIAEDGVVWLWNPAMELLTGYTEQEMVGGTIERIMPYEMWEQHKAAFAEAIRTRGDGITTRVECDVTASNGDVIPVEVSVRVLRLDKRTYAMANVARRETIVEVEAPL